MDSENIHKDYTIDPSYDADLGTVEYMVNVSRGENALPLNMRYAAEAIEYWRSFEKYITTHNEPPRKGHNKFPRVHTPYPGHSEELTKALTDNLDVADIHLSKQEFLILRTHKGSEIERYLYIKNHLNDYKATFYSLIIKLQSNEYKQETSMAPFIFIAYLNSLDIFPPRYLTAVMLKQLGLHSTGKYLLPTRSKYLTYNSYLYSISNGIDVIPIGPYDTMQDLMKKAESNNFSLLEMDISFLYNRIFMLDIPNDHRKLNVFSIWFALHETHTPLYQPSLESSLVKLTEVYNKIGVEHIEHHKGDINSFRPLLNDKNVRKSYALMKHLMKSSDISYLDDPMKQVLAGRNPSGKVLFVLILTVSFIDIQEKIFGNHIDSITTPIIMKM